MSALAFHAAPPAGHWLNDPNALVWADGAYRLFAQHRADAPDYKQTGWARFSSPDLCRWRYDGVAIPPLDDIWAYSGSVLIRGNRLEAFHTEHRSRLERQLRRTSSDGGASWTDGQAIGPPPGRNRRDPFVFRHRQTGDWRMLLARPCDWTDWRTDAPSDLLVLRSDGHRLDWEEVGRIGPSAPPGVMWEVPLLVESAENWALIVSVVDRRRDIAECSVRYWMGGFDGSRFVPHEGWPDEGRLLDLGPDFYAAMTSSPGGWPTMGPLLVGWLASWHTARHVPWPGFSGGPISIPRLLESRGVGADARLCQHPAREVRSAFARETECVPVAGLIEAQGLGDGFTLRVESAEAELVVHLTGRELELERRGAEALRWSARHRLDGPINGFAMFVDGPAIELFFEPVGQSCSFALPASGRAFSVALECGGQSRPLRVRTLA